MYSLARVRRRKYNRIATILMFTCILSFMVILPADLIPNLDINLFASEDVSGDDSEPTPPPPPTPVTPTPPITPIPSPSPASSSSNPTPSPTPYEWPTEKPTIHLKSAIQLGVSAEGMYPSIDVEFLVAYAHAKWTYKDEDIEVEKDINFEIRWDSEQTFTVNTEYIPGNPGALKPNQDKVTSKATVMMIRPYGEVEGISGEYSLGINGYIEECREGEYLYQVDKDIHEASRDGEGEGNDIP